MSKIPGVEDPRGERPVHRMLFLVLLLVLLAIFVLMVVWRRHLGRLASCATLVATIMLMLWMQESGLLPGTSGPLSDTRPKTRLDAP